MIGKCLRRDQISYIMFVVENYHVDLLDLLKDTCKGSYKIVGEARL